MARASRSTTRSRSRNKSNTVSVDLSSIESSGRVKDGDYAAVVDSVELKESESGNNYLNWKLKVEGGTVYHITSLQPQALFNLRNTLEAAGMEIPDGPLDLDLDELAGLEFCITVENETYQGKKRPRCVDVFPADMSEEPEEESEEEPEEESEEEPEEEPKEEPKSRRGRKPKEEAPAEPAKRSRRSKKKVIGKGSEVSFEDDGETYVGTVTEIDEEYAAVDVDGEEWEIEISELTMED